MLCGNMGHVANCPNKETKETEKESQIVSAVYKDPEEGDVEHKRLVTYEIKYSICGEFVFRYAPQYR